MGTEQQAVIFGAGIVCGIIGGLGADGYRVWRSAVRIGRTAAVTADCLCWCVLAAVVAALLFYLNGGEMRSYFFAAMLIGYIGYRYAAGDRVVRSYRYLTGMMHRAFRMVWIVLGIVTAPLFAALRCIAVLGRWLKRMLIPKRKSPPEDKN